MPQKRGPRWKTRRTDSAIEEQVLAERAKGKNRYEIHTILRTPENRDSVTFLHLSNRATLWATRLTPSMQEEKRRIMKIRAGELAHIDCHHLSKDLADAEQRQRSLTDMFATMRCFHQLAERYGLQFEEALTDNGPEFGPKGSLHKEQHPFERLLLEMGIKHRYPQPYRPQTNGKVERFWCALNEDLTDGAYFENEAQILKEWGGCLVYYKHAGFHQRIKLHIQRLQCKNQPCSKNSSPS